MKHFVSHTNPMRAQYDAKAAYTATHFAWSYEQVDDKGGVGTITLNRPERKNRSAVQYDCHVRIL